MNKKLTLYCVILSALASLSSQASLTWIGTNATFFQESNWLTDAGVAPAANTVNPNTNIPASITAPDSLIVFGPTGGNATFVGGNIDLGLNDLIIDGLALGTTVSGTNGLRNLTADNTAITSTATVTNGGSANFQFGRGIDFVLDGASTLTLRGGNDPLADSTVDFQDIGSQVVFLDEDVAAFTAEHLGVFTVNGAAAVIGTNIAVTSDGAGGSIVTVIIPEPSSIALMSLIMLVLLFHRKKTSFVGV